MLVLKNLMFVGALTVAAAPPAEEAPGAQPVEPTTSEAPPSAAQPQPAAPPAQAEPASEAVVPPEAAATPAGAAPPTDDTSHAPGAGGHASGPEGAEPHHPEEPPHQVSGAEPPMESGRSGANKVERKPKSRSHLKTGGISVAPGIGFGLTTAGDKFCGQFSTDNADQDGRRALCTGATPWAMDFTAMYGVFDRLDISLGLRLNLQPRAFRNDECPSDNPVCDRGQGLFNNTLGVGIMPGVRIWGGDVTKIVKMGGAIDFLYMYESFSGYRNRPLADDEDDDSQTSEDGVSDHMLGLRAGPILQIDPHHNVGIFLIPAAVPSFRPARDGFDEAGWFEIAFEATLGVQGRFP